MEKFSSPTVKLASVFISLVIAAVQGRKASTHDVGTAFFNAGIAEETVHVVLDNTMTTILLQLKPEYKHYVNDRGEIVMQLDKALLYGCVQSV